MSCKTKLNTRRNLHKAARRATLDASEARNEADISFQYRHEAEMRKMLKGIDPARFERLADG